jgi:hypothetical protein
MEKVETVIAALKGVMRTVLFDEARRKALRPDSLREDTVGARLVVLTSRPSGASRAELAEVTEAKDPTLMLRYACKRAGLPLRFVPSGERDVPGRYYVG